MAMEIVDASSTLLQLRQQHREYKAKLEVLAQKLYLTEEEKLEEIRLKKLKLLVKDELTALESGHSA